VDSLATRVEGEFLAESKSQEFEHNRIHHIDDLSEISHSVKLNVLLTKHAIHNPHKGRFRFSIVLVGLQYAC